MSYQINLNVTAKTQTTLEDGDTKYVTFLQSIGDEVGGVITITTEDPETDAFFVTNGDYSATVDFVG